MNNNVLTGKIIKIIDEYKLVINKGSKDGVSMSNEFLVYYNMEELFDAETGESLGFLEIICGKGKPYHIQENFTTIESSSYSITNNKTITKRINNRALGMYVGDTTEEVITPEKNQLEFENVCEGYLFKQIK